MAHQVTAPHLTRLACLYVLQSTLQQVFENTESTSRHYALRDRARALGWADERIVVIDQDLGHAGASTADRLGFQRLVAEVGLGQVGLVLGLEVSRLARNSSDWHHLLEMSALTHLNLMRNNISKDVDSSSLPGECRMAEIRWEQYPLLLQHELARNWLQRQAHLQLAPDTVDAYGRCLNDYQGFCA